MSGTKLKPAQVEGLVELIKKVENFEKKNTQTKKVLL